MVACLTVDWAKPYADGAIVSAAHATAAEVGTVAVDAAELGVALLHALVALVSLILSFTMDWAFADRLFA